MNTTEFNQTETERKNNSKNLSITKLWDNFKQANTCGSGIPKNEEIMAQTLPNLKNYKRRGPRQSLNSPNQKNKENYIQVYHNQIA